MWKLILMSTLTLTLSLVGQASIYTVLSKAMTYLSIELNDILGNHSSDSLVRAVAALISWIHYSVESAPDLL